MYNPHENERRRSISLDTTTSNNNNNTNAHYRSMMLTVPLPPPSGAISSSPSGSYQKAPSPTQPPEYIHGPPGRRTPPTGMSAGSPIHNSIVYTGSPGSPSSAPDSPNKRRASLDKRVPSPRKFI